MSSILGIFLILLVNAIFAFVFTLEQLSVAHSYPFFITGLRMLLGGMLLVTYQKITHPGALNFRQVISKKSLFWILFLLALFNFYLTNGPEVWGLQYVSGAKTAFIYNLAPFISAFFSYIHFDEKMNIKKWVGLIIAFTGFMPVILSQTPCEEHLAQIGFLSMADIAIMIAATSFVYGWIITQKLIKKNYYNITSANGIAMLGGAFFCFAHSLYTEPWTPIPFKQHGDWPTLWLIIVAMVFFSNIIAYSAYSALLKKYTATFLSFTGFSCYLFAAFYDWVFTGMVVPLNIWIASCVFFIGLYIFYKEELAQGYMNKT